MPDPRSPFARASISEIARMAGVSRPSIYAHFPSLDHVLFELGWRLALQIVRRLAPETTLASVLDRLVDALIEAETSVGDALLFRELVSIFSRRSAVPDFDVTEIPVLAELMKRFEDARAPDDIPGLGGHGRTRTSPFGGTREFAQIESPGADCALKSGSRHPPRRTHATPNITSLRRRAAGIGGRVEWDSGSYLRTVGRRSRIHRIWERRLPTRASIAKGQAK